MKSNVKIVSDGSVKGTKVLVDEKPIYGVTNIVIHPISADQPLVTASIRVILVNLELAGETDIVYQALDSHAQQSVTVSTQGDNIMTTTETNIHQIQTITKDLLAMAARGEIDLNQLAKQELANRGQDQFGKWVGFDKAAKIHGLSN